MTQVNPATATLVTTALAQLTASLAKGDGSGASSTHHRQLVLSWFLTATEDTRMAAPFDPEADYTKLGARGIEMALAHYTKFLHDPENEIALKKASSDAQSAGVITLPSAAAAGARIMIVECVDMMLKFVVEGEDHYTQIWDIAKGSYDPLWVDTDEDGIIDAEDTPINLTAPVLSAATRALTVTNGTWTGTPTSYEYVWYLDGEIIEGQTDATYTVPNDDAGDIQVRIVATNAIGDSEPALSNTLTITAV